MNKTLLPVLFLSAGLLSACTTSGPTELKVHEVAFYGVIQERIMWVYGKLGSSASSSIKINANAVDLRAQITDPLAVAGTLSVGGKATYRIPSTAFSQKLSVIQNQQGGYSVSSNLSNLQSVYVTDGRVWRKVNAINAGDSGQVVQGLQGAGALTAEEATALGSALLGQGRLAIAVFNEKVFNEKVFNEKGAPDGPLTIEPKPQESLRTALYISSEVITATTGGNVTPSNPPSSTSPTQTGTAVAFSPVAAGSQAKATTTSATITSATITSIEVATTVAQAKALYAKAYGNQTSIPTPPSLQNDTLIGVFMGQHNTGGYSVKVIETSVKDGVLTVVAQFNSPAANSITTQALTSPWTIVKVSGTYSQVRLIDSKGNLIP